MGKKQIDIKRRSNEGYAGKMKDIIDGWLIAERETDIQFVVDMYTLALSDKDLMGEKALTVDELEKVIIATGEAYDMYHEACEGTPESDYWQEKLDSCLKEVCGDKFAPFKDRYPYIHREGLARKT